ALRPLGRPVRMDARARGAGNRQTAAILDFGFWILDFVFACVARGLYARLWHGAADERAGVGAAAAGSSGVPLLWARALAARAGKRLAAVPAVPGGKRRLYRA